MRARVFSSLIRGVIEHVFGGVCDFRHTCKISLEIGCTGVSGRLRF